MGRVPGHRLGPTMDHPSIGDEPLRPLGKESAPASAGVDEGHRQVRTESSEEEAREAGARTQVEHGAIRVDPRGERFGVRNVNPWFRVSDQIVANAGRNELVDGRINRHDRATCPACSSS